MCFSKSILETTMSNMLSHSPLTLTQLTQRKEADVDFCDLGQQSSAGGDVECLKTLVAVTLEGRWYQHLVGRGQGCGSRSHSAQDSSGQRVIQLKTVPRLRNPGLKKHSAPSPLTEIIKVKVLTIFCAICF